jgi:hypothetical protein
MVAESIALSATPLTRITGTFGRERLRGDRGRGVFIDHARNGA